MVAWFLVAWLAWSGVVLWHRWSWLVWLAGGVTLWTLGGVLGAWGPWGGVLALALMGGVATAAGPSPWRRQWSDRARLAFRRRLPPISATEQTALDAGTVGFEASLLAGRPAWNEWLAMESKPLTAQEQAFIDGPVNQVCRMTQDWLVTHRDADLSPEVWAFLKEHRFFGMIIPTAHGGLGFSARAHAMVIARLASASSTLSATVGVPNSLGPAELLLHYGTEAQRDYYLPRLARGEEIPCFALTGPEAGSDATSLPDFGVVVRETHDGREQIGLRVSFRKRYITLAPVATLIGLAFRLHDPEGLLGGKEDRGLTLAIIPRTTEGLKIGRRHLPLNSAFHNGPMEADGIWVPLDAVVGGQTGIGRGWAMLMECLSVGRAITLPATSAGIGRAAALATGAYARLRHQFGLPLGRFEAVGESLSAVTGQAIQTLVWSSTAADLVDAGERPSVVSAMAKAYATGTSREAVQGAMDIHGGKGIVLGPRNYLGRWWQASPIAITVEGANLMTRALMIVGQGLLRCHPWLRQELDAVREDNEEGSRAFDRALFGHVADATGATLRALGGAWWGAKGSQPKVAPAWRSTVAHINRQAAVLRVVSEAALGTLGGKLKFRERLTMRMADAWSNLYLACAVIRWHEQVTKDRTMTPEDIMSLYQAAQWATRDALGKAEKALWEATEELPAARVGTLLRWTLFPWGRRHGRPGAVLDKNLAEAIMRPGLLRDILAEGAFVEATPDHPMGRLHHALPRVLELEPTVKAFMHQWAIWVDAPPALDTHARVAVAIEAGWCDASRAALVREHADMIF
jgi:acyl-CoA dehydrogenase